MTRPRITARHHVDSIEEARMCSPAVRATPSIGLVVEFDRGDHLTALRLLEAACEDVRRQIADAAEGSGE